MIPWSMVENGIRHVPDSRGVEEFSRLEKDRSNILDLKYNVMKELEDQPGNRKKVNDSNPSNHNWLIRLGNRFISRARDVGQR